MNEKTHSSHERPASADGGIGGIFDDNGDGDLVTVASGPYAEQLPVGNMTVGEVRARFRDRFDIDPRSQAVLGGNDVGDDTRIQPGQVLMFVRRAGEKGLLKSETRMPKSERNPKSEARTRLRANTLSGFRISGFGILSDLGVRIAGFC